MCASGFFSKEEILKVVKKQQRKDREKTTEGNIEEVSIFGTFFKICKKKIFLKKEYFFVCFYFYYMLSKR
jgi:hypothetical protein